MLLIQGWLKLATGEFDKVQEQAAAMVAATNAEDGCIHYAFARDITDPDLIHISERWASEEALGAHSASAHMAAFQQALDGLPEHYRSVFELCIRQGKPYQEAGEQLGLPTGTVAIRIMRARKRLFGALQQHLGRLRRPPACFQA